MKIVQVRPQSNYVLSIVAEDGRVGQFDVRPYLSYEAFEEPSASQRIRKGLQWWLFY